MKEYSTRSQCIACGAAFALYREDQVYCSRRCRQMTWAKANKQYRCRASAYVVEWRQLELQGLRRCKICAEIKPLQEFWGPADPGKRRFKCASCCSAKQKLTRKHYGPNDRARARAKRWREQHPDLATARIAAWRKSNPEYTTETQRKRRARAAKAGVFRVAQEDLHRLFVRQQFSCGLCFDSNFIGGRELDHIIPISRGGRHSIGNLMWLCHKCNRKKHTLYLAEVKYGKRINSRRHSAIQQRSSVEGMPTISS